MKHSLQPEPGGFVPEDVGILQKSPGYLGYLLNFITHEAQ